MLSHYLLFTPLDNRLGVTKLSPSVNGALFGTWCVWRR